MPLPKVEYPVFMKSHPITGRKFNFRPFTIKEQKALATATEGEDREATNETMLQIMEACYENFNPRKEPGFVVEEMFLELWVRSVGGDLKFVYQPQECPENENKPCKEKPVNVVVNLEDVSLKQINDDVKEFDPKSFETSKFVKFTENSGVHLIVPDQDSINLEGAETVEEFGQRVLLASVEKVVDGEEVYGRSDFTEEELEDYVDSLPADYQNKILEFFNNIPQLYYKVDFKCPKCGLEEPLEFMGLKDFFSFG